MPGVIDVARHAGTSAATVSRVFSGASSVRPETRKRVVAAARALGYRPDLLARNLRRRQGGLAQLRFNVGVMIACCSVFATVPVNLELIAAVEAAVRERGFGLRLIASRQGPVPPEVLSGDVDGVIVYGSTSCIKDLSRMVPTVTIDAYDPTSDAYGIMPDYRRAVCDVTGKLLKAGHRRVVVMCGEPETDGRLDAAGEIAAGCAAAYRTCRVTPPDTIEYHVTADPAVGYEFAMRMFTAPGRHPDAIIVSGSGAPGVYRAAEACGLAVPRDLSVVGVSASMLCEYLSPPLTVIDPDIRALAEMAARIVTECASRGERRRGMEITPVTLVERNSARLPAPRRVRGATA
jgi:DNA-binding LacI/PurR family transcriptional regulator